jgi:hypothetical protein
MRVNSKARNPKQDVAMLTLVLAISDQEPQPTPIRAAFAIQPE